MLPGTRSQRRHEATHGRGAIVSEVIVMRNSNRQSLRHAPHILAGLLLISAYGEAGNNAELPEFMMSRNADGVAATYSTSGPIDLDNPFFKSLGGNGRA